MSTFNAKIDRVDVVEASASGGTDKALGAVKARFSQFSTGQHAEYTILVMADGNSYQIRKRFSEFADLHNALKARYSLTFDLPAKTPIRYFNPDKLEDRKNALNAYLKEFCRRGDLVASPEARRFFASEGQPPISAPAPQAAAGGGANAGYPTPNASEPRNQEAIRPQSQQQARPKVAGPRHDDEDDLIGWDN